MKGRNPMKRGFTLIEMLIVVVVLTTLMTIVFKLSNIGGDSRRRSETITRMQKLENCLSGYYAAFGSYPPVKLHGTRSINFEASGTGVQTDNSRDVNWGDTSERQRWDQIKAACMAQPVECDFPFEEGYADMIKSISDTLKEIVSEQTEGYEAAWKTQSQRDKFTAGFDDGGGANIDMNNADWRNVQLFRFGLMSYLLPRYLVMMGAKERFYDSAQWEDSNAEPPCDPFDGKRFSSWRTLKNYVENGYDGDKMSLARVASIPSQAVCARWMPNLKEICTAYHNIYLFGVQIRDPYSGSMSIDSFIGMPIFSPSGNGNTDQYVLDSVSVRDGWGNTFYYYSPAPYQRYTLWSSGPNGRTFPPWISRESLDSQANKVIAEWIKDDIRNMSN